MNESVAPSLLTPVSEAPNAADAGQRLRQLREASGMHIAGLAATLKVPVARLQALEEGRLDDLPDLIFARALAGSVCRALKQDPAPVLAAMPLPLPPPALQSVRGLDAPIESRAQLSMMSSLPPRPPRRFWSLLALLLVLALLALGAWWWQGLAPTAQPLLQSPAVPLAAEADSPPAAEPAPPPTLGDALPPPTQDASAAAPAPLRLSVSGVTWVQVTGASGVLRLERTLQPGDTLELTDDLPLQVVVGRAHVAQVWLRGEPLDLASVTRNQVARFEVR